MQLFKIIVESSLIAHSIGNFILKNFNSEHFLIKLISDEIYYHIKLYEVTWRHIWIWHHISPDISFIKKCSELKFFNMKFQIEWAICRISTIILQIHEKCHFTWKCKIKTTFAAIEKNWLFGFFSQNFWKLKERRLVSIFYAYFVLFNTFI